MKNENATPNIAEMQKDIEERFADELKNFDSIQVHIIKDDKSIANASMRNKDVILMREVFDQSMPDILANLAAVLDEEIKRNKG